ncbi:MAG: tRNA threonylcarbamoyladenosine biosynthesis protein TsaB, partial [Bacteroidota bacterium]
QMIRKTSAEIITPDSFSEFLNRGKTLFFGDGAAKCKEIISHENALFSDNIFPSVSGMVAPAFEKFNNRQTEDIAYFEPFYLKDFVAGKPRVKGLE